MELKDRGKGCYSRGGGGGNLFSASHRGGLGLNRGGGSGAYKNDSAYSKTNGERKACLKEQYLKCKCSAQLTTFVASNRCNYAAVYARNIMHSSFRRKLSLLLIVSCYPS